MKSAVGAARRDAEARADRPGGPHVLRQRLGLVDEHVRSPRGEALVGHHVLALHADRDVLDVRHGLRRVGHVLVVDVARVRRRLAREPAGRGQVERERLRVPRWPGVQLVPLVAAGLEDERFGQSRVPALLEVLAEERQLDFLLEEGRRGLAEPHRPERLTGGARPSAVWPRAHHQPVLRSRGSAARSSCRSRAPRRGPRHRTSLRP